MTGSGQTARMSAPAIPLRIALDSGGSTSALLRSPPDAAACFVFAHGAGAGMHHSFMTAIAEGLAERGIATLRFQFPYMEQGSKRPDAPAVAQQAVAAAVREASARLPGVPLFAGGKSFGGRMTSQARAAGLLPQVRGLVFVGFPLHPAGKPATSRADHLANVDVPMLFLQGTRDELADIELVRQVTAQLGQLATLHVVEHADHSFQVLVRSGRKQPDVQRELLDTMEAWMHAQPGH